MNTLILILFIFSCVVSTKNVLGLLPTSRNILRCWRLQATREKEPLVLEGLPLVLERRSRPEHPQFARRKMELPLAVQLMRQSYAAVDKLCFVPTDEFQRSFFLFRQSEWDDWRTYYPGLMQGDLADPLYFDHVSFCQYAVIADKIRRGKQSFIQLVDADGTAVNVRRDPRLSNNDVLPAAHSALVGDAVLDWLISTYPTITPQRVPFSNQTELFQPPRTSKQLDDSVIQEFRQELQAVLDLFEINAYALGIKVELLPAVDTLAAKNALFSIRLIAPANLWGSQVLRKRGDLPVNDFEIKVCQSLARRRGLNLQLVSSTVVNNSEVLHIFKLA